MLDSSSSADFEGANSEQKRIKLEEQQLGQTQGKVSALQATSRPPGGPKMPFPPNLYTMDVIVCFCRVTLLTLTTHLHPEWCMLELFLMDAPTSR